MTSTINTSKAYTKLILAIFGWAGVYHAASIMVATMDVYTLGFFRYLLATLILLIILKIRRGRIYNHQEFCNNWLLLALIGVIGIGLYNIAFFNAEKHLSANTVALIFAVNPCLTALLAAIFIKTKLRILGYLGMSIALCGTLGVINFANPTCGKFFCSDIIHKLSLGEIYALLMCSFAAIFSILNRVAAQRKIDALTITTYAAFFGVLTLLPLTLWKGNLLSLLQQNFTFWLAMLYTVIIGSVIAYFWYAEAINDLGVNRVVVFLNGIPFATILLGVMFFHEVTTLPVIGCGAIIIIGVVITNRSIITRTNKLTRRGDNQV